MSLFDFFFGCKHRAYSWPYGKGRWLYVVCMDCGQKFTYDWYQMQVSKRLREIRSPKQHQAPVVEISRRKQG